MVTGASGDGKSSLIFAGLLPNIRAGFFKAKHAKWQIAIFRPGNDPVGNFAAALTPALGNDNVTNVRTSLALGYSAMVDLYKSSPLFMGNGDDKHKGANLLVVVDQFEEFFTNKENFNRETAIPSQNAQTVANLLIETIALGKEQDLPIYIVCTMRSDYIGNAPAFRGLPELIGKNQFFVPRLNREEMLEAITEPAMLSGAKISLRLAQRMLNDLGSINTDVLPVLQHALRRVWQLACDGAEELDLWHYCAVGGMPSEDLPNDELQKFKAWFDTQDNEKREFYTKQKDFDQNLNNVLNLHANILFDTAHKYFNEQVGTAQLTREQAQFIIQIAFKCLTKIDDSKAVRNRMTIHQIEEIINDQRYDVEVITRLLNIFRLPGNTLIYPFISNDDTEQIDQNTSPPKGGELRQGRREGVSPLEGRTQASPGRGVIPPTTLLDITHEALIRNWKKLSIWTKQEYDSVLIFKELDTQLNRWIEDGRQKGHLLSSGPYEYFEKWYKTQRPNPAWLSRYTDDEIFKTDGITLSPLVEKDETSITKTTDEIQPGIFAPDVTAANLATFFTASKQNIDRLKNIRRKVVMTISFLLIAAVGALIWAVIKKNQATELQLQIAKTANANRIATTAYTMLEHDPTLAFRLAEASYNLEPTPLNKQVIMAAYAKVPFYSTIISHNEWAVSAKYSPDGKFILATIEKKVVIWDLERKDSIVINGFQTPFPYGHLNEANFSSNSKFFAFVCPDSSAKLYDVRGTLRKIMKHDDNVNSVIFSKYSELLLTLSYDKTAKLWDFNGNLIATLNNHKGLLMRAAFIEHDKKIITSCKTDSTLRIWDIKGNLLKSLTNHKTGIKDISISSNERYLLTSSWDSEVILWDLKDFSFNHITKSVEGSTTNDICFAPDNSKFAVVSEFSEVATIFDLTGNELAILRGHTSLIWSIQFSPNSEYVLTTSDDGTARLWNMKGIEMMILKGHNSQIFSANFSPDGKKVLTTSSDGTVRKWMIIMQENPILKGHSGWVYDANFSSDGKKVITASWDNSARLWDISGTLISNFTNHTGYTVSNANFIKDNYYSVGSDGMLRLWDNKGDEKLNVKSGGSYNYSISINNDSSLLAIHSFENNSTRIIDFNGNVLQIFEKTSGINFLKINDEIISVTSDSALTFWIKQSNNDTIIYEQFGRIRAQGSFFHFVSYSNDGRWMVTLNNDSTMRIWDTKYLLRIFSDGNQTVDMDPKRMNYSIKENTGLLFVVFSPVESKFTLIRDDNILQLWGVKGKLLAEYFGHSAEITNVNFSPDGHYIVSTSADKSVRLWNLYGKEIQYFPGHTAYVMKAMFSPDGKYILSASLDHTARLMPWRVEDVLDKINIEKVRGEVWQLTEQDKKVYGIVSP